MPRQRGDGGKTCGGRSSSWARAIDVAAFCVKHCSRAPDLPMESDGNGGSWERPGGGPGWGKGMGARMATRNIFLTKANGEGRGMGNGLSAAPEANSRA